MCESERGLDPRCVFLAHRQRERENTQSTYAHISVSLSTTSQLRRTVANRPCAHLYCLYCACFETPPRFMLLNAAKEHEANFALSNNAFFLLKNHHIRTPTRRTIISVGRGATPHFMIFIFKIWLFFERQRLIHHFSDFSKCNLFHPLG